MSRLLIRTALATLVRWGCVAAGVLLWLMLSAALDLTSWNKP
ncbi:hypothetical protein ACTSKR_11465 [Chitinibacteraceae bacterium HSL-7]